jgi:putative nucleotidyltransferase with HDIG domain
MSNLQTYFPISLSSLRVDSVPSFDLFLYHPSRERYVLYREKNLIFGEETLEKLRQNDHRELFVPREQRDDYFEYSSRLVADVIDDPSIPTQEKSKVVYTSTATIMEDLFVTPRSSTRIRQAKDLIHTTVDFLTKDEEATRSMIFLTEHDYYTYTHSVNVTIFATALSQKVYGPDSKDHNLHLLGEGFLLHDIGKSTIPSAVINKPGKLSDTEWAMMRQHPEMGYAILREAGQENEIISRIVLEHP